MEVGALAACCLFCLLAAACCLMRAGEWLAGFGWLWLALAGFGWVTGPFRLPPLASLRAE